MTRYTSSRVAAALFFLLSSTASSFIVPNTNNYYHHPSARPSAALHATTEDFQRSLLAAQIAHNSNKPNSSPAKKSITAPQPSSVDYDAAARLAYESSGSTDDFSTFKLKYLQDTSNLVATKQRTRIAKEKAAEMKEKAMKAAEAAKVAKEKAQMKIREREDALAKENEVQPVDVVVEETVDTPEPTITATTTTTEETPISTTTTTTESTTGARVPRELAIVPINDSTIQFTAGALGLTAGLVLGGPILAIFLSATANYLSRKDDAPLQSSKDNDDDSAPTVSTSSPKRIVDAASQTALYLYNFLAQFERDNKIVDSTLQLLESSISTAKKQSSETGETIIKIESTLGDITKSAQTLNDQYDLVGGAGTVLNTVGDLVEDSVDRVIDLNEQFRLTERVGGVVTGAVKKVTEKKD